MSRVLRKCLPKLSSLELGPNTAMYRVRKSGGRDISLLIEGTKYTFKFKDLLKHIRFLAGKELTRNDSGKQLALDVNLAKLSFMLLEGKISLKAATVWQRIVTFIRQFFGNFGKPSHFKTLESIRKKWVLPKTLDKSNKLLMQKLIKAYETHQVQIKGILALRKTDPKKLDNKKNFEPLDIKPFKSLKKLVDKDWRQAALLLNDLCRKNKNYAAFLDDFVGYSGHRDFAERVMFFNPAERQFIKKIVEPDRLKEMKNKPLPF